MNWQEELKQELEKLLKNLFDTETIKERLKFDRRMIFNLLISLNKIETVLIQDITDISNMPLDTKISYYCKEKLNEYLFNIRNISVASKDFIQYCDRATENATEKKGENNE